jgi:hypothetical protein
MEILISVLVFLVVVLSVGVGCLIVIIKKAVHNQKNFVDYFNVEVYPRFNALNLRTDLLEQRDQLFHGGGKEDVELSGGSGPPIPESS